MKFLSYLRKQTGAAPLVILEVLGIAGVVIATSYYITTVAVNNATTEESQTIQEVKDGGLTEGSVSLDKLSDSVFLTGTTDSGDITSATIQDAIVTVGSLDKNIFNIIYQDGTNAKVTIGEGKITDFHLKDGSVTTVKILDNAVTTAKLQDGSITAIKILDGTITGGKLANGAITTQNIQDGAITSSKLQDGAVTTSTLQDNSITTAKLTDQSINAAKIATNTITGS